MELQPRVTYEDKTYLSKTAYENLMKTVSLLEKDNLFKTESLLYSYLKRQDLLVWNLLPSRILTDASLINLLVKEDRIHTRLLPKTY